MYIDFCIVMVLVHKTTDGHLKWIVFFSTNIHLHLWLGVLAIKISIVWKVLGWKKCAMGCLRGFSVFLIQLQMFVLEIEVRMEFC